MEIDEFKKIMMLIKGNWGNIINFDDPDIRNSWWAVLRQYDYQEVLDKTRWQLEHSTAYAPKMSYFIGGLMTLDQKAQLGEDFVDKHGNPVYCACEYCGKTFRMPSGTVALNDHEQRHRKENFLKGFTMYYPHIDAEKDYGHKILHGAEEDDFFSRILEADEEEHKLPPLFRSYVLDILGIRKQDVKKTFENMVKAHANN